MNERRKHVVAALILPIYLLLPVVANLPALKSALNAGFKTYQNASAEESRPTASRPIWVERKHLPASTRVEIQAALFCFIRPLEPRQQCVILPELTRTSFPLLCVYVRFWPRDPPQA